jgi:hypothetical protein
MMVMWFVLNAMGMDLRTISRVVSYGKAALHARKGPPTREKTPAPCERRG